MSIESAQSFVERMKKDEEFAKKVEAFEDAEQRMTYVKESGFEFTFEELNVAAPILSEQDHYIGYAHSFFPVWGRNASLLNAPECWFQIMRL